MYFFLRSYGGEGFTIKFQLADPTTKQGKKDRRAMFALALLATLVIAFVMFLENSSSGTGYILIGSLFIGGFTALMAHLRKR